MSSHQTGLATVEAYTLDEVIADLDSLRPSDEADPYAEITRELPQHNPEQVLQAHRAQANGE
jgi:hypothetical protein